jgi:hypothetical protein
MDGLLQANTKGVRELVSYRQLDGMQTENYPSSVSSGKSCVDRSENEQNRRGHLSRIKVWEVAGL